MKSGYIVMFFFLALAAVAQTQPAEPAPPQATAQAKAPTPVAGQIQDNTYVNADMGLRVPVPHAWLLTEGREAGFLDVVIRPVLGNAGAAEFTVVDTSVYPSLASGDLSRKQDQGRNLVPVEDVQNVKLGILECVRHDYHAEAGLPFQARLSTTLRGWRLLITLDAPTEQALQALVQRFDQLQFVPVRDTFGNPPQFVRVSDSVMEGFVIKKVPPEYPPIARNAQVQGPIVLEAIIGKDGKVKDLHPISGHPMLMGAAVEAVRQWEYRPYLLNGEPVEVQTTITVNFVL